MLSADKGYLITQLIVAIMPAVIDECRNRYDNKPKKEIRKMIQKECDATDDTWARDKGALTTIQLLKIDLEDLFDALVDDLVDKIGVRVRDQLLPELLMAQDNSAKPSQATKPIFTKTKESAAGDDVMKKLQSDPIYSQVMKNLENMRQGKKQSAEDFIQSRGPRIEQEYADLIRVEAAKYESSESEDDEAAQRWDRLAEIHQNRDK